MPKKKGLPKKRLPKKVTEDDIRLKRDPRKHNIKQDKQLRRVPVGNGLPTVTSMAVELADMTDVLIGRVEPPLNAGHLTLMEVADAYFARASEMTMLIQKAERENKVTKGDGYYKFRTGELRTFRELAKSATELGSRRLTKEQLIFEMTRLGRESGGSA